MLNINSIKSLTDLRTDPAKISELAERMKEPVYIFNRNKPVSVLLDINSFQEIMEKLEDALDALDMREFEKLPKKADDWISHDELVKMAKVKK